MIEKALNAMLLMAEIGAITMNMGASNSESNINNPAHEWMLQSRVGALV